MSFEFTESSVISLPDIRDSLDEFRESSPQKLIVEVASIHEGLTANYNNYSEAELIASLKSWVEPYPKPILLNHNPESEPMGRVMAARMDKEKDNTPFTRLQIAVLDPAAVAKVTDERYITGSVGGKATTAMCSICNTDWAKPSESIPCKHKRGNVYSGKLAYLNLGGLTWKEYSFVNMPADGQSGVRSPSSEDGAWVKSARLYSLNMNEESILELNESENPVNILENMKKKDAHYTYMNVKGTFLTATAYDYKENMDTNITFNKTNTTIDNELSTETLAQTSNEVKISEEIEMSTAEKTEDFLSIVQSLSADLAASPETVQTDSDTPKETSEIETSNEASDELSEDTDVKTDPEEEKLETKEDGETEENTETDDSNEQLSETADSNEEQAEKTESTETNEEDTTSDPKDTVIATLTEENDKLKKALHFMLAERVVDTKIALGMVEVAERANALTEHSTRTAASLADAVRDLEKLSISTNLHFTKEAITKVITPKTHATEEKDNDHVVEETEEMSQEEVIISPVKKLEDIMVNKLMNRKPSL